MQKFFNSALKIKIIVFVALASVFFSSVFTNTFDLPKLIILVLLAAILLLAFAWEIVTKGKAAFKLSNIDLPLFLLVISVLASGIIKSQNKMEVFFFPGIATAFIAIFIVYLSLKKIIEADKMSVAYSLLFSAALVSLLSMFSYLGIFAKIPQLPDFVRALYFSPMGGKLPEIIFLTTILPFGIYLSVSEKNTTKKMLAIAVSFVIVMAIVIGISFVLPGKPTTPVLVSFPVSWSVAADTIKLSPVFGIGTANYLTAFDKFLPVTFNQSPYWNARFSTSRSFVLTLVTENGLFGAISFGLVIFLILKEFFASFKHAIKNFGLRETTLISLVILSIFFFLFPASVPLITLFFILIATVFASNEITIHLSATSSKSDSFLISRAPAFVVSLILVIGVGFLSFFGYKYSKAERIYKIAVVSLANNDGKTTYDALKAAINTNPYVDRYHSTYAQVNLALARSLAQKKELNDQDRATVAQLIQQGIREAKATVTLNPQRAGNWEVLAGTYRSVVPFAQGADQFAIQSYNQAASLDPINPNLRIALGGVYYALGRYDEAISTFKLAVLAKNDLANAHYNLAIAYREKKDLDNAISEMQTVISLVDKNSEDYSLAIKALDELQKNKTAPKTTESTDNLNAPKKNEASTIKPAITLPSDSNPPATGQ